MADHNTLIGGTAREIEGGTVLIGGVLREIESGTVLVGGVAREFVIAASGPQIDLEPVFADNTWEQIIIACQNNAVPNTWSVADSKPMTVNGTDYLIDIIGKNHDDYADGSGKAPLTFQFHDCFGGTYAFHATDDIVGWKDTDMRLHTLPDILSQMPAVIQTSVREVSKGASTIDKTLETTVDKMFLLAEGEVQDSTLYSIKGEGSQYEYYSDSTRRVKYRNRIATRWWGRSRSRYNANAFTFVDDDGSRGVTGTYDTNAVSPAFCF